MRSSAGIGRGAELEYDDEDHLHIPELGQPESEFPIPTKATKEFESEADDEGA